MKSWLFRILGIARAENVSAIEANVSRNISRIDSIEERLGGKIVSQGDLIADEIMKAFSLYPDYFPSIEDQLSAISEYLGIKFVQKSEQPAKVVAVSTRNGSKGGATPKKKPTKKN
jgi:hypothetical protein